jgi:hypothetical protein
MSKRNRNRSAVRPKSSAPVTRLYRFHELSKKAKRKVIDSHWDYIPLDASGDRTHCDNCSGKVLDEMGLRFYADGSHPLVSLESRFVQVKE